MRNEEENNKNQIKNKILYHATCKQPESLFGLVEGNEQGPGLWVRKEGDGERSLLLQSK